MMEIWRNIEEYKGLYQVSNLGRVRSLWYGKERILKPTKDKDGYLRVQLYKNGKAKLYGIHRLVAMAFIDNPYNLPQVNHKNETKDDNRVENLEWCNHLYNINYGTCQQRRAEKRRNDKLSKTVYQYTLDGKFIAEYPSGKEIQRQLGYNRGYISSCCLGKYKTAYGYIWKYNLC